MPPTLFLIVGPSGVGKDTLLNTARAQLQSSGGANSSSFIFVQRVITRPRSTAAHDFEDHEPCSVEDFHARKAKQEFALHWHAHDTFYGITFKSMQPLFHAHTQYSKLLQQYIDGDATKLEHINNNIKLVANVSRSIIEEAQERFPFRVVVIEVNANEVTVRNRLLKRGRETMEQIDERIAHNRVMSATVAKVSKIHRLVLNDGTIEQGTKKFIEALTFEVTASKL